MNDPKPHLDLISSLKTLTTEERDPKLSTVDLLSIEERCRLQNELDCEVPIAVGREVPSIVRAVEMIAQSLRSGGRLIYVGAGTSGRLGVLDATEMPPTFGADPSLVQGIIAGGIPAMTASVEGVEDDRMAGAGAIEEHSVSERDTVVGIAASGLTPYVLGALDAARTAGASTVAVTNNRPSEIERHAEVTIAVVVGPEFVAGSTRLKSGTAQKLVLNMLTTQAMIELGKTFGNAMVDVMATNEKLKARAHRLVQEITGASHSEVTEALSQSGGSAKLAILMLLRGVSSADGIRLIDAAQGKLRVALGE